MQLTLQDEITTGVAVSVIIIAVVSMTLYIRYTHLKRRSVSTGDSLGPEESQLCLQSKVELDAGQVRQEVEAREVRYEMQGEGAVVEMSTEESLHGLASFGRRHELRGEEHSKELEVPRQPDSR